MVEVSLEVHNIEEAKHDLQQLGQKIREHLIIALKEAAELVKMDATSRVRQKSGKTKKSLETRFLTKGAPKAFVGSRYFVAGFLEKGTRPRKTKEGWYRGSMPASPYLGPAVDKNIEKIRSLINEHIDKAITEVIKE